MERPVLAASTNNPGHRYSYYSPQNWLENCVAPLLAPLTIWLCVSISIRYGYYGDYQMLLGPSSSRLFHTDSLFVKQVELRDTDRKGVVLYGFRQKPELSQEQTWSASDYVLVGRFSRKGYWLWLNNGSRIQIRYQAESSTLDLLQLSIIKGEGNHERLLPRNSSSSDNHAPEGREADYTTEEDDKYYIGITNLNGRSIMVLMNISVSSRMYDNSKAERMCATGTGSCRLDLPFPDAKYLLVTTPNNGDINGWSVELSFVARLVAYFLVLALILTVSFLVVKFLGSCAVDNPEGEETPPGGGQTETAPLLTQKALRLPYGTDEEDQESGTGSSSEDLYNGKICVICYDKPRNCFFVPCGHCATCQDCANRIMSVESRICPICRRVIHKMRKVIIP